MATIIYTKIKDLEIQDKEVFQFGNWLKNFNEDTKWSFDEGYADDEDDEDEFEVPKNKEGDEMQYPWDDFSYIIVPDNDTYLIEAEKIAENLGSYERYDIEDSDRTFFVVK